MVVVALVQVPGLPVEPRLIDAPSQDGIFEYTHGWPLTYLRRARDYSGPGPPSGPLWFGFQLWEQLSLPDWLDGFHYRLPMPIWWGCSEALPLGSDRSEWHPLALVVDLVVSVALVFVASAMLRRFVASRGGAFRLRTGDLFVLTGCLGAYLGVCQWHASQAAIETGLSGRLLGQRFAFRRDADRESTVRIVESLDGWSDARCLCDDDRLGLRGDWPLLPRLFGAWVPNLAGHRSCYRIFPSQMTAEDWSDLRRLRYLERLVVYGVTADTLEQLGDLPRLRDMAVTVEQSDLNFTVDGLARLKSLELLTLRAPVVLMEDLKLLTTSTSLRCVEVDVLASAKDLERFHAERSPRFDLITPPLSLGMVARWRVARARIDRWRSEVGKQKRRTEEVGSLDMSGVPLTPRRLQLLADICPEVRLLTLGYSSHKRELITFVESCPVLADLNLGDLEVDDDLLAQFTSLARLHTLSFSLGAATPGGLYALRSKHWREVRVRDASILASPANAEVFRRLKSGGRWPYNLWVTGWPEAGERPLLYATPLERFSYVRQLEPSRKTRLYGPFAASEPDTASDAYDPFAGSKFDSDVDDKDPFADF